MAVFLVVYAIGAAISVPVVQNDLEDRVEDELREQGVDGVTASFSGQDGTLVCAAPLDDPERARDLAATTWGVRVIALDDTCHAGSRPGEVVLDDGDDGPDTESTTDTAAAATSAAPAVTDPAPDPLAARLAGDPLFSQFAGLVEIAGLAGDDTVGGSLGEGPLTVFAPTDAAFDAAFDELGADAFGAVTSDPDTVRALVLHHLTDGRIAGAELTTGPLTMLDGNDIQVDAAVPTFTSGDVVAGISDPATQLDIEASDGVIHAIDRVLLPPGLELAVPAAPSVTVTYRDGRLVLTGVVDETQRTQLLAAAEVGIDSANVTDELVVDAEAAPAAIDVDRLAVVVEAMPANLVSGTATLEGARLGLDGVVRNDDARAALDELAAGTDVDAALVARPPADEASAAALEDELNTFAADNPILFEPSSVVLSPGANAILEQVAARALRVAGVDIVVVGHTDSDGTAEDNQLLSDGRAAAVAAALVELGLGTDDVTAEGRGAAEPVVDADGAEDKAASRRVEFLVTVQ